MKELKFDSKIESIYNALSDEQKAEYKNQTERLYKGSIIFGIIFLLLDLFLLVGFIVSTIRDAQYGLLVFCIIGFGGVAILSAWMIYNGFSILKSIDDIKVKIWIKRLENQKKAQKRI